VTDVHAASVVSPAFVNVYNTSHGVLGVRAVENTAGLHHPPSILKTYLYKNVHPLSLLLHFYIC